VKLDIAQSVTATFGAYNLVFHTSLGVTPAQLVAKGGGSITAGADAFCNERAQAGGLGGNYVGGLATSPPARADRTAGRPGCARLDGLPFADSPTSLLGTGQVFYPVVFNEFGVDQDTVVMTGTHPDGTYDPGNSCQNRTTLTPQQNYLMG